jgi:hypothetical protein
MKVVRDFRRGRAQRLVRQQVDVDAGRALARAVGRRRAGHADDRALRAPGRRLPHGQLAGGQRDRPRPSRVGVPNLLVCDGSVMPTQGAANPALTIMALASRLAERLAAKR